MISSEIIYLQRASHSYPLLWKQFIYLSTRTKFVPLAIAQKSHIHTHYLQPRLPYLRIKRTSSRSFQPPGSSEQCGPTWEQFLSITPTTLQFRMESVRIKKPTNNNTTLHPTIIRNTTQVHLRCLQSAPPPWAKARVSRGPTLLQRGRGVLAPRPSSMCCTRCSIVLLWTLFCNYWQLGLPLTERPFQGKANNFRSTGPPEKSSISAGSFNLRHYLSKKKYVLDGR